MRLFRITSILTLVIFLASCAGNMSIAKKRYSSGYNISLFNKEDKEAVANAQAAKAAREVKKTEKKIASTNGVELKTSSSISELLVEGEQPNLKFPSLPKKAAEEVYKEVVQDYSLSSEAPSVLKAPVALKGVKKIFFKKALKRAKKATKNGLADDSILLLVILSLLLPPLAVYLYEDGWTGRVTLNLILTLLCGLPGVIHALIVILGNK